MTNSICQSTAIQSFVEEHGEGRKFYVYQSVLRVLNLDGNEDFNQLIKNVRRIVIHQPDLQIDSLNIKMYLIDELVQDLFDEEFEELIQAKEQNMRLSLMSRGAIEDAEFVLIMRESQRAFIAEVEGSLNMAYIGALANAKMSELTDYLK
jgi:hypothetical protein